MKEVKTGYMCSTDFHHELENDIYWYEDNPFPRIYPNKAALEHYQKCVIREKKDDYECGVYKVEIRLVKVIRKGRV